MHLGLGLKNLWRRGLGRRLQTAQWLGRQFAGSCQGGGSGARINSGVGRGLLAGLRVHRFLVGPRHGGAWRSHWAGVTHAGDRHDVRAGPTPPLGPVKAELLRPDGAVGNADSVSTTCMVALMFSVGSPTSARPARRTGHAPGRHHRGITDAGSSATGRRPVGRQPYQRHHRQRPRDPRRGGNSANRTRSATHRRVSQGEDSHESGIRVTAVVGRQPPGEASPAGSLQPAKSASGGLSACQPGQLWQFFRRGVC